MRSIRFLLAASLAVGGATCLGCSSSSGIPDAGAHPGFQGGNGEFGESTEQAGVYDRSVPARHRLSPDEQSGFQGGDGAFGESPESPGKYAPSAGRLSR
jgi:hypothetical protein